MKKLLKVLAALFVLVLLLAGGLVAFIAYGLDEVVNANRDKIEPRVEAVLGREVEIGAIRTSFLPVLGAELRDVKIKGRTADEAPLLVLESVSFSLELWAAIKSMGNDLRLNSLVVDGLTVHLVREADGSLSYEDVLQRLSDGPPPAEKPEPLDSELLARLRKLQLKRVAVQNSGFQLVDRATGGAPATTYIKDLLIELDDVVLDQPFELHVAAAVFAEARNFDLRVKVGPLPIGQASAPPPPIDWITLKAEGIDLSRIVPYLGPGVPIQIESAAFSADLRVDDPRGAGGQIKVGGTMGVKRLAVGSPQPGAPFDLQIAPQVDFDPKKGVLDLTGFSIALDDMVLSANGRVEGLTAGWPQFKDLRIKTERLDLGRLLAMLPDVRAALPPGAKLDGRVVLDLDAAGNPLRQTFKLDINLDEAGIFIPGAIAKPIGTPLNAQIDAANTIRDLDLKSLKVAVGPLDLAVAGTVKDFKRPTVDIKGGTGRFDINGLVRLLPNVASAIPPEVKVAGQAEVAIDVAGNQGDVDGRMKLGIFDADLAVPGTTIKGTGTVDVTAKGNPAGALAVNLEAALSGLGVVAGDAFTKPAGTPLEARVALNRDGDAVHVSTLDLQLGPLKVAGSGTARAGGPLDLRATVDRFSVAALGALVPALKETPIAQATLGAKVAFAGNPADPATVSAKVDDFYFGMGPDSLTGSASVEDLEAPRVRFAFTSPRLDLDGMFPPGGVAPAAEADGGEVPPIVKRIDARGTLDVERGRVGGVPFTALTAALTMTEGALKLTGTLELPPDPRQRASPDQPKPGDATPVGVTFAGTIDEQQLGDAEADELIAALAAEVAKHVGRAKLEEAERRAEALARGEEEAAQAKVEAAKKRAEAARARAEAAKRVVEAREKAKQEKKKQADKAARGPF